MPTTAYNLIDWLLGFIDTIAARWTRARHMTYRRRVRAAEARGDVGYLRAEAERNQLTMKTLHGLRQHHTPVVEWPEQPDDLFAPTEPQQHEAFRR